jgi:DNA gyrase subunit A
VQAISLSGSATIVGADWVSEDDERALWVASTNGFVKRTVLGEYPRKGRATGGVATMQLVPKTMVEGAAVLDANEDALLISETGRTARISAPASPLVARDRRGSVGLKLEGTDRLLRLMALPT